MGVHPIHEPRLFARSDAAEVIDALSAGGWFVPTLLPLELGQRIRLTVDVEDLRESLDLPARIIARRLPPGARGRLCAGVVVQLDDRQHPRLRWLAAQLEARRSRRPTSGAR